MTNAGIFNPNSRNRNFLQDDELSTSHTLNERELLVINVDSTRKAINSVKGFEEHLTAGWLDGMVIKLAEAEKALADYDQQAALAHIDELAGDERFTTQQMDDGIDLFLGGVQ